MTCAELIAFLHNFPPDATVATSNEEIPMTQDQPDEDLGTLVQHVARLRGRRIALKAELDGKFRRWQDSESILRTELADTSADLDEAEGRLRAAALVQFAATGNKQIVPGVVIKTRQKLTYDPAAALDWAKQHSLCLILDKKAFEQIATTQQFNYVTYSAEHIATLAKQLPEETTP